MKKQGKLPILFIVGYGFNLILLLLIIEYYCRGMLWQWFTIPNRLSPFFQLFEKKYTNGMANMIAGLIFPVLTAVLWKIYYVVFRKKYIDFPTKKTKALWSVFLTMSILQWFIYGIAEGSPGFTTMEDLYCNYFYYTLPGVIMIIFFVFNILDFVRLIKLSKQEITK